MCVSGLQNVMSLPPWKCPTHGPRVLCFANPCLWVLFAWDRYDTVESHESRNGAREDFLEPVQWSPSICLKCGQQAVASGKLEFFVSSCWLGCLSSTLTRFSAIPTFMRFYGIFSSPFGGGGWKTSSYSHFLFYFSILFSSHFTTCPILVLWLTSGSYAGSVK